MFNYRTQLLTPKRNPPKLDHDRRYPGKSPGPARRPAARRGGAGPSARGAKAAATQRAYAADWRHYTAWCRRRGLDPLPPDPQVVGLYLAASASEPPAPAKKPSAVRTTE